MSYLRIFQVYALSTLFWSISSSQIEFPCPGLQDSARLLNVNIVQIPLYNELMNSLYHRLRQRQIIWHRSSIRRKRLGIGRFFDQSKRDFFGSFIWNPFPSSSLQHIQLPNLLKFRHHPFKTYLEMGPFRKYFKRRYSCIAIDKFLLFWQTNLTSNILSFFSNGMVQNAEKSFVFPFWDILYLCYFFPHLGVEILTNYFYCRFHIPMVHLTYISSFIDMYQSVRTLQLYL